MVEIISKGIPDAERKYFATCSKCKTSFSFKKGEARLVYDRRDGNYLEIACPVCPRICNVDETPRGHSSW